jgi:membrane-associated protein
MIPACGDDLSDLNSIADAFHRGLAAIPLSASLRFARGETPTLPCVKPSMVLVEQFFEFLLHFDQHLKYVLEVCGGWTYAVLFAIVFCETGLVVTPFLPGDSLLFAAGTFAGTGQLSLPLLIVSLFVAAVLGDTVNYWIGRRCGAAVLARDRLWLIRREYLKQAEDFFARHGGKAVVLARFTPIIRTFVPFVAGAGMMSFPRFMAYNVVGGIAWVLICTSAGYAFGQVPLVRDNFSLVAIGIVIASITPSVIAFLRSAYLNRFARTAGRSSGT